MFIATVLRSLKAHFTRRMDDSGGALLTLFYTEVREKKKGSAQYWIISLRLALAFPFAISSKKHHANKTAFSHFSSSRL
jgi:hypothetical protein